MTIAVLLNSGGIESRVCAAMLHRLDWDVRSLFLDWNERARPAAPDAAQMTADLYCSDHTSFVYPLDWATYIKPVRKYTTPYATATSTILGVQYAQHIGAEYVVNGSRREVSRDKDFRDKFNDIVNSNTMQDPKVVSYPLWDLTDAEVIAKATELGVDLTTTYSCSVFPPCGECHSCKRREML